MTLPQPKWWILVSLGIGTFMSALDGSVVNVILPVVERDLHSKLEVVQWVATIYLLIVSGLLLTFGRLGDIRGHRTVCVSGFGLFVFSSALCGLSPSTLALIAARALQAIGAAMIFASSPAILTSNFPPEQRGQALGLQATMTYLGLACGPSLGGWLTGAFGWQSVFFVNVPVGLVAMAACLRFVPSAPAHNRGESFDLRGAALFMLGLAALMLALNRGHDWGWTSPSIVALVAVAVLLLAAFLQIERIARHPMLDLGLFRCTLFWAAAVSAVMNYTCTAMVTFLMPFYLIKGLHWSPLRAGLLLTAQPLLMAVTAPVSGTVSDRLGRSRLPAIVGMAILTLAVAWLSCLKSDPSWTYMAVGLAAVGLGTGMFISPNNSALMGAAPRNRQGIAAGIMATARNFGMALGIGLAGAIVTTITVSRPSATLAEAIAASFFAAAAIAALGTLTSMIGGKEENPNNEGTTRTSTFL